MKVQSRSGRSPGKEHGGLLQRIPWTKSLAEAGHIDLHSQTQLEATYANWKTRIIIMNSIDNIFYESIVFRALWISNLNFSWLNKKNVFLVPFTDETLKPKRLSYPYIFKELANDVNELIFTWITSIPFMCFL